MATKFDIENEHSLDKPVDEKCCNEIAEYCANDVLAIEAALNAMNISKWAEDAV